MKNRHSPPPTVMTPFGGMSASEPASQSPSAPAEASTATTPVERIAGASGDAGVGQKVRLPVSCLETTPFNSRFVRTPERIHELMEEMRADGQRMPITVAPRHDAPNRFLIIDGETRYHSGLLGNFTALDAIIDTSIDTSSPLAIYTASRKLNGHIELSDIDQGVRWAQLIDQGEASIAQLAAVEGLDENTISMKMVYGKLPPLVMAEVRRSPKHFPYSLANEIYRLGSETDESTAASLANKVVAEDLSRRDVKRERERLEKAYKQPAAVQRRRSRRERHSMLTFGDAKGEFSVFQTPNADGRSVLLKLDGLSENQVLAVSEFVERLQGEVGHE